MDKKSKSDEQKRGKDYMAKHYANNSRRRKSRPSAGAILPLIIVMVIAIAILAAVLLLPMGQVPWLTPPAEESSQVVTVTDSTTTTTAAEATTTTAADTTTTTTETTTTTTAKPTEPTQQVDEDGLYLDAKGMLQFPVAGNYVQAASYTDGKEIPWNLMLVNDWNPLPAGYEDKVTYEQLNILYRRLDSHKGDSRVLESLDAMMAAGRKAGIKDLAVQSAYRTVSKQNGLYWDEVKEHSGSGVSKIEAQKIAGTVVKRPGYSEHHLGLAFDLGGNGNFNLNQDFENTAAFKWLIQHCHEYGFILRFPKDKEAITGVIYEPWHYRYVGVEAATAIMEGGLCLEEYLEQNNL